VAVTPDNLPARHLNQHTTPRLSWSNLYIYVCGFVLPTVFLSCLYIYIIYIPIYIYVWFCPANSIFVLCILYMILSCQQYMILSCQQYFCPAKNTVYTYMVHIKYCIYIYTLYIYGAYTVFLAGQSTKIYSHVRCIYTVLANPSYMLYAYLRCVRVMPRISQLCAMMN